MPLALRTPGVERAARLCGVQSQPRFTGTPTRPQSAFYQQMHPSQLKKVFGWPPGFETQ